MVSAGQRPRRYGSIALDNETQQIDAPSINRPPRFMLLLSAVVGVGLLFSFMLINGGDDNTALTTSELLDLEGSKHLDSDHTPHYYKDQLVDHFDTSEEPATWTHRYYTSSKHFGGPGHPIFMVLGGEGPALGLFYPFIQDHLAKKFNAYVLQPEHRFYGTSQPIEVKENSDFIGLLTSEQAMADFLRILQHIRVNELGCSMDRSSDKYCPVITVGGSYPGFLSAMMRFVHPEVVDISYASSAPLYLYAQELDSNAYYDKVTDSAARYSPSCPAAVKATLTEMVTELAREDVSFVDVAHRMGICTETIPEYIVSNEIFSGDMVIMSASTFADANMANYPPSDKTDLAKACNIFEDSEKDALERMKGFFKLLSGNPKKCFDLQTQIVAGANATLTTSDWSGAGDGETGRSWDFQTCTELVIQAGLSEKSMFPAREWTMENLNKYCEVRFGIDSTPTRLVDEWHFNDLVGEGASRILFTNGGNDGWSVVSILESLSDSIIALNFPNGAHHSDLSHEGPSDKDTDDVKQGFVDIEAILGGWLAEIRNEK